MTDAHLTIKLLEDDAIRGVDPPAAVRHEGASPEAPSPTTTGPPQAKPPAPSDEDGADSALSPAEKRSVVAIQKEVETGDERRDRRLSELQSIYEKGGIGEDVFSRAKEKIERESQDPQSEKLIAALEKEFGRRGGAEEQIAPYQKLLDEGRITEEAFSEKRTRILKSQEDASTQVGNATGPLLRAFGDLADATGMGGLLGQFMRFSRLTGTIVELLQGAKKDETDGGSRLITVRPPVSRGGEDEHDWRIPKGPDEREGVPGDGVNDSPLSQPPSVPRRLPGRDAGGGVNDAPPTKGRVPTAPPPRPRPPVTPPPVKPAAPVSASGGGGGPGAISRMLSGGGGAISGGAMAAVAGIGAAVAVWGASIKTATEELGPFGAALAVANPLVGLFAAGLKKGLDLVTQGVEEYAEYSGAAATAMAQTQIHEEIRTIRRAQRVGPEVAALQNVKSRIDTAMYDTMTEIKIILARVAQKAMPLFEAFAVWMETVVDFLELFGERLDVVMDAFRDPASFLTRGAAAFNFGEDLGIMKEHLSKMLGVLRGEEEDMDEWDPITEAFLWNKGFGFQGGWDFNGTNLAPERRRRGRAPALTSP